MISYTPYTMLHITAAHVDFTSRTAATSHTSCTLLHMTACHGDLLSRAAVIFYTSQTMLRVTAATFRVRCATLPGTRFSGYLRIRPIFAVFPYRYRVLFRFSFFVMCTLV